MRWTGISGISLCFICLKKTSGLTRRSARLAECLAIVECCDSSLNARVMIAGHSLEMQELYLIDAEDSTCARQRCINTAAGR